jgi:hypothetical protein
MNQQRQPLGQQRNTANETIGLNSVTKNRTLKYPDLTNLIKQRTVAEADMVHGFTWNKEEQGADADVLPGLLTPQKKTVPRLASNCTLIARQDAADNALVWMIHPTPTAELENQQDSILPAIATALATTTVLLGTQHNILVMGRAALCASQ